MKKLSCGHGKIQPQMLDIIDRIEKFLNREITVTSGFRCPECNAKVGGVPNSAHMKGLAIDIKFDTSKDLYFLLKALFSIGIMRIGINFEKKFVHMDIDDTKPLPVVFGYLNQNQK